jgi:hypothetical protein
MWARGEPPALARELFVPNPPKDPESADGQLAGLSRSRLLALGGLDPLPRGGLEDLLIE